MKTVLHIFTRDLIRILKNPIAIIVTIGVCIIPSLYAWFNIAANWDPYKNTQTMPVAVVSEDTGAEVGDQGYLNAGFNGLLFHPKKKLLREFLPALTMRQSFSLKTLPPIWLRFFRVIWKKLPFNITLTRKSTLLLQKSPTPEQKPLPHRSMKRLCQR